MKHQSRVWLLGTPPSSISTSKRNVPQGIATVHAFYKFTLHHQIYIVADTEFHTV